MFSFWSKFYVNIMFYSRVVAYLVSRDMIGYLQMKNAKKTKTLTKHDTYKNQSVPTNI